MNKQSLYTEIYRESFEDELRKIAQDDTPRTTTMRARGGLGAKPRSDIGNVWSRMARPTRLGITERSVDPGIKPMSVGSNIPAEYMSGPRQRAHQPIRAWKPL